MKKEIQKHFINTKIGKIAVFIGNGNANKLPVIFLHGVYFDHHLWDAQIAALHNRTTISLDMPLHGESKDGVPLNWAMDDVSEMLLEILSSLNLPKVIAIGHSWGSMTILRAATKNPAKFAAIGLCNMPFEATTSKQKIIFKFQHLLLPFRNFYTKQVSKAIFAEKSLKEKPLLLKHLRLAMSKLKGKEIKATDQAVILEAVNTSVLIKNLKVKNLALKGIDDYVPEPKNLKTIIVPGGHVSALEAPLEVINFCKEVFALADDVI